MKHILITIIAVLLISVGAKGEFIRENTVWTYNVSDKGSDEGIVMFFSDSEVVNEREYKYLNVVIYPEYLSYYIGKTLMFGNVNVLFTYLSSNAPTSQRIFLMREEGNKVYMYNDKNHVYTKPLHSTCTNLDLGLQTDNLPEEILIYDFDANPGDCYNSIVFEKDGKPSVAEVKVYKREEQYLDIIKSCMIGLNVDYSTTTGTYSNIVTNSLLGSMECFISGYSSNCHTGNYRMGNLVEFCSPRQEITYTDTDPTSIKIRLNTPKPPCYQFEVYSQNENESQKIILYSMLPDYDSDYEDAYCMNKVSNCNWSKDDGSDLEVDNSATAVLQFRKTNGVVYVKSRPEWIDAETGSPFPEGTELIYADMNVKEGDMFPTFEINDNVVNSIQKNVKALTCTILPDKQKHNAVIFCDENGVTDDSAWYIDGIGFYGPEDGVTVFNGGRLNNIYDADGKILVKGDNVKIPEYVGVNEVGVSITPEVIYTIEGLRVNGSMSELPAGLYIVNGKKIAVTR